METTIRSQLEMRYSTYPADMGYGNQPVPELLSGRPSACGTPRKILAAIADVLQKIGPGTYLRIEIRHRGEIIPLDMVKDVVWDSDFLAENRR